MRRCTLFAVVLTALVSSTAVLADEDAGIAADVQGEPSAAGASEPLDFEEPLGAEDGVARVAGSPSRSVEDASAGSDRSQRAGIVLGPEGVDDQGRKGRLHTVAVGDTLWDLSSAYLGTPWVWPSVWIDNDDIEDPHLILPGDKIWITADEMRVVSDAEADSFLASSQEVAETPVETEATTPPAAPVEIEAATLEQLPVEIGGESEAREQGREITVSRRDAMGFLSAERFAGSSTILDSPSERALLAEGDPVYLGMGEGEVEVGDRFTVFRVVEEIRDAGGSRLLGHHVETLGWIEVTKLTGDTSIAEIRMSYTEIERGARVTPRPEMPRSVTVRTTPDAIEGKVVFLPSQRTLMADGGYVYLNRGELHGVEAGSELEVYESGRVVTEETRDVDVRTPDHVVARLVVVRVEPESSVAFVLNAERELAVGDSVRPTLPKIARR